jgi:hypothetical protein
VVYGNVLELAGLSVDHVCNVLDLLVNDLTVLDVDQGSNESDCGSDESQSPEWNKVNEAIRDESGEEDLEISQTVKDHNNEGLNIRQR